MKKVLLVFIFILLISFCYNLVMTTSDSGKLIPDNKIDYRNTSLWSTDISKFRIVEKGTVLLTKPAGEMNGTTLVTHKYNFPITVIAYTWDNDQTAETSTTTPMPFFDSISARFLYSRPYSVSFMYEARDENYLDTEWKLNVTYYFMVEMSATTP